MHCPKCKKEIEEDTIFCSFCGVLVKGSEKKTFFQLFDFNKHKSKLFIAITLTLLTILILLIRPEKITPLDVDLEFSIYPEEHTKAIILASYFDSTTNFSVIEDLFSLSFRYDVPLTVFITADALNNSDYLSNIINLSKEFNLNLDIESAGYNNVLYKQLEYYRQEELIKQSRRKFRDEGVNVYGFLPITFSYNYNTILAAENNNIRYIALPGNEAKPYHPMSPLQMNMNIMIFPIYQGGDWLTRNNGTFTILLNPNADLKVLESLFKDISIAGVWLTTMQGMNDYIRVTEKMEAEIVTDYKKLISDISFRNLVNDTKIEFKTVLKPKNITLGNVSTDWRLYGGGFFLLLNEEDKRVNIEWEKIK